MAELRSEVAKAQLIRFDLHEPVDRIKTVQDSLWLDLCLTPRPPDARACYPDAWDPHHFERIGEIFFVPPGATLHARSEPGSLTCMVCQIDPGLIEKWFDGDLQWTEWRLKAGLDVADRSIRGQLLRLTREVCHPGFASEMLFDLIVPQLAIELGRYCASIQESRAKIGLAAWRLRLIDERVRELGKAPSLSELAELCNLSVRQLSRGFRTSRGCSIGQYVEQTRVENAKRLLIAGKSIKSIAFSMGFSSPSSFSFAFRRTTGISPAEYRDKV
jgi:AraC family transcriptional regulator